MTESKTWFTCGTPKLRPSILAWKKLLHVVYIFFFSCVGAVLSNYMQINTSVLSNWRLSASLTGISIDSNVKLVSMFRSSLPLQKNYASFCTGPFIPTCCLCVNNVTHLTFVELLYAAAKTGIYYICFTPIARAFTSTTDQFPPELRSDNLFLLKGSTYIFQVWSSHTHPLITVVNATQTDWKCNL